NKDIFHRLAHIIRLEKDENFILFDQKENIEIKLQNFIKKKIISGTVLRKEKNKILKPDITFILPLLKKEHFELALYSLVELGANTIQILITHKSQKKWDQKLYARSLKIMASSAEQSKNFAIPQLQEPIAIQKHLESVDKKEKKSINIFFDSEGESLHEVIKNLDTSLHINLMIGPEADLTTQEKKMLKDSKFIFCKLTPTILRSFQAAAIGLGSFRSLLA
ncbi:RsmE family RNA methyltransferase, partial [Candidatus Dependentiae bacterium]